MTEAEKALEVVITTFRKNAGRSRCVALKGYRSGDRIKWQRFLSVARAWEKALSQVKGLRDVMLEE